MNRVPFVEIDGEPYRAWWSERFEPSADPFAGMRFYQRGKATVWVGTADIGGLETTHMDAVGLHLARVNRHVWKPTSAAIIAFGSDATQNFIDLSHAEMVAFLRGETTPLGDGDDRRESMTRGFISVRRHGIALGCGELHHSGDLDSLIPRRLRALQVEM